MGGLGLVNFFYKESKLKYNIFFFFFGGGGGGGGGVVWLW